MTLPSDCDDARLIRNNGHATKNETILFVCFLFRLKCENTWSKVHIRNILFIAQLFSSAHFRFPPSTIIIMFVCLSLSLVSTCYLPNDAIPRLLAFLFSFPPCGKKINSCLCSLFHFIDPCWYIYDKYIYIYILKKKVSKVSQSRKLKIAFPFSFLVGQKKRKESTKTQKHQSTKYFVTRRDFPNRGRVYLSL